MYPCKECGCEGKCKARNKSRSPSESSLRSNKGHLTTLSSGKVFSTVGCRSYKPRIIRDEPVNDNTETVNYRNNLVKTPNDGKLRGLTHEDMQKLKDLATDKVNNNHLDYLDEYYSPVSFKEQNKNLGVRDNSPKRIYPRQVNVCAPSRPSSVEREETFPSKLSQARDSLSLKEAFEDDLDIVDVETSDEPPWVGGSKTMIGQFDDVSVRSSPANVMKRDNVSKTEKESLPTNVVAAAKKVDTDTSSEDEAPWAGGSKVMLSQVNRDKSQSSQMTKEKVQKKAPQVVNSDGHFEVINDPKEDIAKDVKEVTANKSNTKKDEYFEVINAKIAEIEEIAKDVKEVDLHKKSNVNKYEKVIYEPFEPIETPDTKHMKGNEKVMDFLAKLRKEHLIVDKEEIVEDVKELVAMRSTSKNDEHFEVINEPRIRTSSKDNKQQEGNEYAMNLIARLRAEHLIVDDEERDAKNEKIEETPKPEELKKLTVEEDEENVKVYRRGQYFKTIEDPPKPPKKLTVEVESSSVDEENVKVYRRGQYLKSLPVAHTEFISCPYLRKLNIGFVAAQLVAFLNGKTNGVIFVGVEEDMVVSGIRMTRHDRDRLRQALDKVSMENIEPRVGPRNVDIEFVKVEPGDDLWVVKFKVIITQALEMINRIFKLKGMASMGYEDGVYSRKIYEDGAYVRRI